MKTFFRKPAFYLIFLLSGFLFVSAVRQTQNDFEISKNLEIFIKLFKELNYNYVDEINPGQLMKTAIDEMLASLDPYTNYIPESEIEDLRLMTTGQYGGIGALIQQRPDYVVISEPYENFPAFKAGLKAGDMILEVNGESAKNKTVSDVSSILKGAPGSKVSVTVLRPIENKKYTFDFVREDVKIKSVPYFAAIDNQTGYIKLTSFTSGSAKEVRNALNELKTTHNISSLIFDLRGNGGGLLNEAISIVNLFVPQGTLVVKTKGKLSDSNKDYLTYDKPLDTQIPIVVLIDGMSASASEIVAGSLQDFDRAVILGRQSFGKGLVQNVISLNYNTRLKVTVAKYYIPSGRCIQSVDYSDKDSTGHARKTDDSKKTLFYTKNNRPVYDAGGIIPDISTTTDPIAKITISLLTKNLIFDFATEYASKHPTLLSASSFQITDDVYKEFIAFIETKEYDYTTETEKKLKDLEETAKTEKYYDNIKHEFEDLSKKVSHNKNEDLTTFKNEISEFLGNEIISRYYYQNGRIEFSLRFDPDIAEAKKTLTDKEKYNSILSGKK